jgi:small ligand-binding sensory domain FIST
MSTAPQCGVGLSRRVPGAAAAAEAVAAALEQTGGRPAQLVLLFATVDHGDPRPLVAAAQEAAGAAPVVGGGASGVLTGDVEIEAEPAVVAVAIARSESPDDLRAVPLDAAGAAAIAGSDAARRGIAVLIADGYSQHPERTAAAVKQAFPGASAVVGALAVGATGVFPAFRWQAGVVAASGAVGAFLAAPSEPIVGVTQGCRPIGPVYTVTDASQNVVSRLDDRPAFEVFAERARPLLDDLARASQTVFLAIPDPPAPAGDPVDDDYVVRGLIRFDPDRGLLAVSEPVPIGTRIRFALRDGWSAREHLRRMIDGVRRRLEGRTPRLGLYFNCAGRGRALFGVEDHDVSFLRGALGDFPLVGMFGGGELAPLRGATRLQLFSGVLALIL